MRGGLAVDNTELHYLSYDPEAIWREMMLAYVDAGGDIIYPGDEKEMLLRSVQAIITQVFAGVDNALRMQTLRYAVGEYLDALGEQRSCERIEAAAATATVTIALDGGGESDTLPAGTAMTADGKMFYLLTEDLEITGEAQTVTAEVVCDRAGSAGNGLTAGAQVQPQITHPAIRSIVAATDAAGGRNRETDDAYRERIRTFGLASVSTGPRQQYESVAKGVSSEIIDARALNLGDGEVGIYILPASDEGLTALLDAVEAALSDVTTRPLTDQVSVYAATAVPYTLNVKYAYDSSTASQALIAQAVSEYREWQEQTIGRAFNPDKLAALLYQAGASRVLWDTGSEFDGGTVAYTEIGENEYCSGSISLAVIET